MTWQLFEGSEQTVGKLLKPVLVLGNFDGVHLAHQKMFGLARELASELRTSCGVYTFLPHPAQVLSPQPPLLISTLSQKVKLIQQSRVDFLILEPFSQEFAGSSPESFLDSILRQRLKIQGLVVGYDFTFGKQRQGNITLLKQWCENQGITLKILPQFSSEGMVVSSSAIRSLIRMGELQKANQFLGRIFETTGIVVKGDQRGRELGFPTANFKLENELCPGFGVYATQVEYKGVWLDSVTNVGLRPTFIGRIPTVETHLLSFNQDLYGCVLNVRWFKKIRDEQKFASREALQQQIQVDIEMAKLALTT